MLKGNVLQCVAVCCSVCQCFAMRCGVLRCVAVRLQNVAVLLEPPTRALEKVCSNCATLQHYDAKTATQILSRTFSAMTKGNEIFSVLHILRNSHKSAHCQIYIMELLRFEIVKQLLQCVVVCCSVSQCDAVCCSVLQLLTFEIVKQP